MSYLDEFWMLGHAGADNLVARAVPTSAAEGGGAGALGSCGLAVDTFSSDRLR
jgi:hypothetical protein